MKTACLVGIALLINTAAAIAQTKSTDPAIPPVQPPPALGDPGVAAKASAPAAQNGEAALAQAPESPGLPPEVQAAAEATELPVITVRQQGNETVEEYRKRGKLVFVRVRSDSGPTKFYVDNPGDIPKDVMQQMSGPSGVVQPVYYKLFEWK
jgi:Protein of unknown function (DUF2782)